MLLTVKARAGGGGGEEGGGYSVPDCTTVTQIIIVKLFIV